MEGNGGRRLAWIAIALSAVALVVSLGGRMGSRWQGYYGQPGQFGPQGYGQMGPQQGWMGPGMQQAPAAPQQGPNMQQGPQWGHRGQRGPGFGNDFRQQGPFGGRRPMMGPGMFFFGPLMLVGALLKLAFVGLLVWLGLRLLRGRNDGGRWGRGGGAPPSRPGPEQEPYTGETTQI